MLKEFFNSNSHIFSNQFFHIKAFLNDSLIDSIDIFIDNRKRIKIEYNEQIIYSNQDRILKFFPKTNQLYIDKPDSILNDFLFSFKDSSFIHKLIQNEFINFKNIKIYHNELCTKIDSLKLNTNGKIIKLNNINIDTMNIMYPDSFFNFNIDENRMFKYDFR